MMFKLALNRVPVLLLLAALALAATTAALADDGADARRGPSAPRNCPAYCKTCVRKRGSSTSAPTNVPDPNTGRRLLTGGRTICTECFASFKPNKPSTGCICPPGTALDGTRCAQCPPNSVAPGGKPGRRKCKPCKPNQIANEEGTKCVERPPECGEAVCGEVSGEFCGACAAGEECQNGVCTDDSSTGQGGCTPVTICDANRRCGTQSNGCDGVITCGSCPDGEECVSNAASAACQSTIPPCVPKSTCDAGRVCGTEDDGCGGQIFCGPLGGACPGTDQCTNGVCVPPAPTCVPVLGSCTVDADCCGYNITGAATICNSDTGTCTYRPDGGACVREDKCGMCHPNCGVNTEDATCEYYGFPPQTANTTCNHSGAGGGGAYCGKTQICCVVFTPTPVAPDANNNCLPKGL